MMEKLDIEDLAANIMKFTVDKKRKRADCT